MTATGKLPERMTDLGRELKRRERVMRYVWLRLMATQFTGTEKRYMELVDECAIKLSKEMKRIEDMKR